MRNGVLTCMALFSMVWPLAGCSAPEPEKTTTSWPDDPELARLADWLTGSFSSAAQSELDADYHDIRIHAVRIWPDRDHGYWIYLEQAAAASPERPYRQRVYHLTRSGPGLFQSRVYALPDPEDHVGRWRESGPLAELGPEDLRLREGCDVLLREAGESAFMGSTLGRHCLSSLRGASFATSEVVVLRDVLISWDRGFEGSGDQVWGAEKGPYLFKKLENSGLDGSWPVWVGAENPDR
jgi:CpeT protein